MNSSRGQANDKAAERTPTDRAKIKSSPFAWCIHRKACVTQTSPKPRHFRPANTPQRGEVAPLSTNVLLINTLQNTMKPKHLVALAHPVARPPSRALLHHRARPTLRCLLQPPDQPHGYLQASDHQQHRAAATAPMSDIFTRPGTDLTQPMPQRLFHYFSMQYERHTSPPSGTSIPPASSTTATIATTPPPNIVGIFYTHEHRSRQPHTNLAFYYLNSWQ